MRSNLLSRTVVAVCLTTLGVAAHAQFTATINVAPPAPRYEVVPAPRAGWVWEPGHYEWRGNQHRWVEGQWLRARDGYDYNQPHWVQRRNGEWLFVAGNWERRGERRAQGRDYGDRDGDGTPNFRDADLDGDGIVNAYDPEPRKYNTARSARMAPAGDFDGDGLQNRRDSDIDGDGVKNMRDRFPYDRRNS